MSRSPSDMQFTRGPNTEREWPDDYREFIEEQAASNKSHAEAYQFLVESLWGSDGTSEGST